MKLALLWYVASGSSRPAVPVPPNADEDEEEDEEEEDEDDADLLMPHNLT